MPPRCLSFYHRDEIAKRMALGTGPSAERTGGYHERDLSTFSTGAAIRFAGKIFGTGIQYLTSIVLARILGVADFGLFILGFTLISFVAILSLLGLDAAAVKYIAIYQSVGDRAGVNYIIVRLLRYGLIASTAIAAACYLVADPISVQFFDKPGLAEVIRLLSLSVPLMALMAICWSITQGYKIVAYTVYGQNLLQPLSNLVLLVFFYLAGLQLSGAIFAWISSSVLTLMVSAWFVIKAFKGADYSKPTHTGEAIPAHRLNLLGFSSPLLLISLLTTLIVWIDTLMVGFFRPVEEVGIYSAASKTAMLTGIILLSASTIFSPMVADLYNKGERGRLEAIFKFATRWIFTLTLPLFMVLVLFSSDLMAIFGPAFVSGWPVLVIISITYFLNAAAGPVGVLLIMSGNQKIMMYNTMAVFILNIIANLVFIPEFGAIGAAYATALSIISYNALMLGEVLFLLKIHPYNRKFVMPLGIGLLTTATCYGLMQLFPATTLLRLVIYLPLFVTIFFVLIYATLGHEEDRVLLEKIRSKLARH